MPALGLFSVEDPSKKAAQYYPAASGTYGAMDKEEKIKKPDKTAGGGLMAAGGGALTGAMVGSMIKGATAGSTMGLPGMVIGAGIGALAYFLS